MSRTSYEQGAQRLVPILLLFYLLPHLPRIAPLPMSFFGSTASSTATSTTVADKDIEVADPPTDSISCLSFSSQADYLAVGSWSNEVCIDGALSGFLVL